MSESNDGDYLKHAFVTQTKGYIDVSLKRELWQQVSNEFKGNFILSHNSGNELEMLKIAIPYKSWQINLSESDTRPLKFEVSFVSQFDYELVVGYEDSFEKILKRLGKREIELGNKAFDDKYLIESRNSEITKRIFKQEIIDDFLKLDIYSFAYTTDVKNHTAKLTSVISRTVNDKPTVEGLIALHMRIIDKLKELKLVE